METHNKTNSPVITTQISLNREYLLTTELTTYRRVQNNIICLNTLWQSVVITLYQINTSEVSSHLHVAVESLSCPLYYHCKHPIQPLVYPIYTVNGGAQVLSPFYKHPLPSSTYMCIHCQPEIMYLSNTNNWQKKFAFSKWLSRFFKSFNFLLIWFDCQNRIISVLYCQ